MFLLFLLSVAFRRARNPYIDPERQVHSKQAHEVTTEEAQIDDCEDIVEEHKNIPVKSVFKFAMALAMREV